MIRFSALNKEDTISGNSLTAINNNDKAFSLQPTKEAKESAVLQLYHEALKQQQCGHLNEAKSLYTDILHSNLIANDETGSLERVKFVILKNLALIAKENGDMSTAVTAYLEASKLDSTDLMVWYQLSLVASTLGDLMIMRKALEQCLSCNQQYWPAIHSYLTVLIALNDYYACLQTLLHVLKIDPYYNTGLILLHHLVTVCPEYIYHEPEMRIYLDKSKPDAVLLNKLLADSKELRRKHQLLQCVTCLPDSIFPSNSSCNKLKPLSYTSLGQWLIGLYNDCISRSVKTHQPSLTVSVSLYSVLKEIQDEDIVVPSQQEATPSNKEVVASIVERKKRPHSTEFEQWMTAPKRRSNRVKAKEKENQDFFQLVERYIPSQLKIFTLPELNCFPALIKRTEKNEKESMEEEQSNGEHTLIALAEVWSAKTFLQSHLSNEGIVHLITNLLSETVLHYDNQWLKTDVDVFINCYELIYGHLNFPPLFCQLSDDDALYGGMLFKISLYYCELKIDAITSSTKPHPLSSLPPSFRHSFHYIQHYCIDDRRTLIRVEWLKGRWFAWQRDKTKAVEMYTKCQYLLVAMDTNGFTLSLPNISLQESIISEATVNEKIVSLKQLLSLEQVKLSYDKGEYHSVIDILCPVLSQESFKEVFLSHLNVKSDDTHCILYLLESLYNLNKKTECIFNCTHLLMELLLYYHEEGLTDEWPKTLSYIYTTIDRCSGELVQCAVNVLRLLVMCIIKTMYIVHDLWDGGSNSCLPVMLPWKLLHVIISCEKWSDDSMMMEATPPSPPPSNDPSTDPLISPLPTHLISTSSAPPTLISVSPFDASHDSDNINPLLTNDMTPRNKGLCFLKLAHTQLGSYSWCCHDNGLFLHYIVSKLRPELKELTNLSPELRELLLLELEQCYYCLYGYPYKKGKQRGLIEHNSTQAKLDWSGALMLIEYYHPSYLPTIDDIKSPQVTPELIMLYKKVVDVIPKDRQVVSEKALQEYINESIDILSIAPSKQHSSMISEIYYLLADDSLKLMDNSKAIKYYQSTLCYCCTRFDSWAGLALAKSRKVTERLDKSDISGTVEKLVSNNVRSVIRCFQEAVKYNNDHCYIVEKFGFFCYSIQSFASQIIKLPQLYSKSKGSKGWSEKIIPAKYLKLSQEQFTHALTLKGSSQAEPWIYHFILGKIYWKLKESLERVLNHLVQSAETLHSDGAAYPLTIEVISKGHAIEALEVHYQFMSMVLKALLTSMYDDTTTVIIREKLALINQLPLGRLHYYDIWKWMLNIIDKYTNNTSLTTNQQLTNSGQHPTLPISGPHPTIPISGPHPTIPISGPHPTIPISGPHPTLLISEPHPTLPISEPHPMVLINEPHLSTTVQLNDDVQSSETIPSPSVHVSSEDMITERWNNTDPLREALYGVAVCAVKFPAYYKPLYRLANTLCDMNQPEEAIKFLLGPLPECFTSAQDKLQPIFALKNNIYQNMWQIQIEEINRPGSFSTHARSCLQLLFKVLEKLNDFNSLLFIAQQLKGKPDHNKQFMRESERPFMYSQALHSSVRTLQCIITNGVSSLLECHKILINANILKNLLTRAEGRKDESVKSVEQCMMTLFSKLWSDVQVRSMFLKDGFTLPHEPTMELCNKYCTTCKDKELTFLTD